MLKRLESFRLLLQLLLNGAYRPERGRGQGKPGNEKAERRDTEKAAGFQFLGCRSLARPMRH